MSNSDLQKAYKKHNAEMDEKLFNLFIQSGADLNVINPNEETALMITLNRVSDWFFIPVEDLPFSYFMTTDMYGFNGEYKGCDTSQYCYTIQ